MSTSDDTVSERGEPKQGPGVGVGSGSVQATHPRSPIVDTGLDSAPPREPMPERIGAYRIERLLGRGGFGYVYLGIDEVLQRPVAIKVPHRRRLTTADARLQFLHEARLAARLQHPGIVVVHEVDIDDEDRCYIVYEYLQGTTLAQRMQEQSYTPAAAVELAIEVASALNAAHRQSLVHRDLKPSNILLDQEGRARVSDFGLAVDDITQREQAGVVSGTPAYMAPEQCRGETHLLDGRTDIWALGVILYELLSRRRPFLGRSDTEIFEEIRHREPKPLRQLAPDVDRDLERIVQTCLQKDPADRFTTAADLAEELRQWQRNQAGDLPSTIDLPRQYQPAKTAPVRSQGWAAPTFAVVGGLLLVTFIALAFINGSSFFGSTPTDSGTKTGAVAPAFINLPPEELEGRRWYPLLTATKYPQPIWPRKEGTAQFLPQPELESITLSTVDWGLLVLGSTQADRYKLQFQMEQNPWTGGCGCFWGLHEDTDGALLCQVLTLRRRYDEPGKPTFYWEREQLRADLQKGAAITFKTDGIGKRQDIAYPGFLPHVLEITIREGTPAATWDAIPLSDLQPTSDLELVDVAEYVGQFGILTCGGQTNFHSGRILLLDGPER
jgi:serine/threonine protein kinase